MGQVRLRTPSSVAKTLLPSVKAGSWGVETPLSKLGHSSMKTCYLRSFTQPASAATAASRVIGQAVRTVGCAKTRPQCPSKAAAHGGGCLRATGWAAAVEGISRRSRRQHRPGCAVARCRANIDTARIENLIAFRRGTVN
jgi:hypothetical protein